MSQSLQARKKPGKSQVKNPEKTQRSLNSTCLSKQLTGRELRANCAAFVVSINLFYLGDLVDGRLHTLNTMMNITEFRKMTGLAARIIESIWPSAVGAISVSTLAALTFISFFPKSAQAQYSFPIESGVAITEPGVVKSLELGGFDIQQMLAPNPTVAGMMGNSELKDLPAFKPVLAALHNEFDAYHKAHPETGVGLKFGKRLFDENYLLSPRARFALVGIVNRMDRSYIEPDTCGEIRFIYRLAYTVMSKNEKVSSRLPMTLNLVVGAKSQNSDETCASVAKRWLSISRSDASQTPAEIASSLINNGLIYDKSLPRQLLRIETNLQMVRWPAVVRADFGGHAEYLLKVFKWNEASHVFLESKLENQIDRDKLLSQPDLLKSFKVWLGQSQNLQALDNGTLIIPDLYLATRAVSTSPGGMARSANRVYDGILSAEEIKGIFEKQTGLGDAKNFEFVRSTEGFKRRLDELSCTGCHQTRTIAGFHFMGRDPLGRYPGNSVFGAGSPHFYADLPRRQSILQSLGKNQPPDFSRSYALHPAKRFSQTLAKTGLYNGWGAHCSLDHDASFKDWICDSGLSCKNNLDSDVERGLGICLPTTGQQVGDPGETGRVTTKSHGVDVYTLASKVKILDTEHWTSEPQSATPGARTGGFPGMMLHLKDCGHLTSEASCGPLPGSKAGFNACLAKGENFLNCLRDFSSQVGLRACTATDPCRDDYICAEGNEKERGVCVPPYFLFQFRVDGHPLSATSD